MVARLSDFVLDSGLNLLDTACDKVTICSTNPTTYAEANSTYALGAYAPGSASIFGAPAARTPNGREVTSAGWSGASVTTTGTGAWLAYLDTTGTRLLAVLDMTDQAVTSGNTWGAPTHKIGIAAS